MVPGDAGFRDIAAGQAHTCASSNNGHVYCWGLQSDGQIGTTIPGQPGYTCPAGDIVSACSPRPLQVDLNVRVGEMAAGQFTSCALTTRGQAYCWGSNWAGQVGLGYVPPSASRFVWKPALVLSRTLFMHIAHGGSFACGIAPNGSAYCWGNGSGTPSKVPDPK